MVRAWFISVKERDWDTIPESKLAWLLILGTIPAGLAGFLLEETAETTFRSSELVGLMLILGCIPMVAVERYCVQRRMLLEAGPVDALLVGAAQGIALIPGVSRSGITISTGIWRGFNRGDAANFAFLLSGPIIAAAGGKQVLDIIRGEGAGAGLGAGVYIAGLITAAIVGYAAIAVLVRFLRNHTLYLFVAYRLVLGSIVIALALL